MELKVQIDLMDKHYKEDLVDKDKDLEHKVHKHFNKAKEDLDKDLSNNKLMVVK